MARCLKLWTNFCPPKTAYCNIVRYGTKKSRYRAPRHEEYIAKESSFIFGPVRNLDGTPVKQKKTYKVLNDRSNQPSYRTSSYNEPPKVSLGTAPHHTDVTTTEPVGMPGARRPSLVRELDLILTFPMCKVFEESKNLVPSFNSQIDIPILNSDEVTSLNKRSALPSVSKVIEKSRPPEEQARLDRWKAGMIRELGEDGFAQWQKATFARGHNLHTCIQKQLETGDGDTDLDEKNVPFWQSVENVLEDVSDVQFLEKRCEHPHLRYCGYFDCIARFRDKLCLIEWKTSKRQKATIDSTFDNPLQVAAYMGAVNFDGLYNLNIDGGLIVVAYENGEPADVHPLRGDQSAHYWGSWLHRLYTYWKLTLQEQEQLKREAVMA